MFICKFSPQFFTFVYFFPCTSGSATLFAVFTFSSTWLVSSCSVDQTKLCISLPLVKNASPPGGVKSDKYATLTSQLKAQC